ncbi:response regulator [Chitinilyticum piscinae]|uniref:Response regulator n=1 Tax=Chitinilyticum piscinae TaxID=2866724 RepID=A0A8J7K2E0_9NEIS|nr:response regulator [Chitinilyticum piscinae]MBE9610376.1 response regulator [Chitinilyticum piscinae]
MPRKPTCILIDDDSVLRGVMSSILRSADIDVLAESAHADNVIELVKQHHPRLVMLDINLPERSGLELLPEILKLDPPPKVVMVTAEATVDRVRTALGSGAAGFVVKPFTPAKLLAAVGHALGLDH